MSDTSSATSAAVPVGTTAVAADGAVLTKVADAAPVATTPAATADASPLQASNVLADSLKDAAPADGGKPAQPEVKTEDKPADKAEMKPEDYKVELPEGVKLNQDDPLYSGFLTAAAKASLPNEAVNAILAEVGPIVAKAQEAPYKAWADLQTTWQQELRADPELGGEALPAVIGRVNTFLAKYAADIGADGKPDLSAAEQMLRVTGIGNNPTFIRLINRAALALSEGTPVGATPAAKPQKDPAQVLYPSTAAA